MHHHAGLRKTLFQECSHTTSALLRQDLTRQQGCTFTVDQLSPLHRARKFRRGTAHVPPAVSAGVQNLISLVALPASPYPQWNSTCKTHKKDNVTFWLVRSRIRIAISEGLWDKLIFPSLPSCNPLSDAPVLPEPRGEAFFCSALGDDRYTSLDNTDALRGFCKTNVFVHALCRTLSKDRGR